MLKKIVYSIHRILGTVLSLLFLMWFLSGMVMLYHSFPKISDKQRYSHMQSLDLLDVCAVDSIVGTYLNSPDITQVTLTKAYRQNRLTVTKANSIQQLAIVDDKCLAYQQPDYAQLASYARTWNPSQIARVDTLDDLEQWIPFQKHMKDMPIYKFYFDDEAHHQLYISSTTGEALQLTNRESRFWSWVGSIPHWVYFTRIRQNPDLWKGIVIPIAAAGSIMCLAGIIIGIRSFLIVRKRKGKWRTPYTRFAYKWHHILGFSFGLFVFTFIFSGMMSLAQVPTWLVKIHKPEIKEQLSSPKTISNLPFKNLTGKILKQYPQQVKQIIWTSVGNTPVCEVVVGDSLLFFDASFSQPTPLHISQEAVRAILVQHQNQVVHIDTLSQYDNYYGTPDRKLPLPVYKVSVEDADNSLYYIDPATGNTAYYNDNTKVRHWTYKIPHRFALGILIENNNARLVLLWIVLIGGTLVSLTGILLSIKYLKRRFKKK